MDGAAVLEGPRAVERVRVGVAGSQAAGAARLEPGPGHVVSHGVLVGPLHGGAGRNRERLRVELDVLHVHRLRLRARDAARWCGALAATAAAVVVASTATGRHQAEREAGAEECCELGHRPNPSYPPRRNSSRAF